MEVIIENQEDLVREICLFLECAIHNILYIREVYPVRLFKKVKVYNVPVFKMRHPNAVVYIKNIVDAVCPMFSASSVDKLCLVICTDDQHRRPLEQYTFSLKFLQARGHCTRASLDSLLRSFLLKINVADSTFPPFDKTKVTYYILLHTSPESDNDAVQRPPRLPLESPWVFIDREEEENMFRRSHATPFKTISTPTFQLELHVEQINYSE